MGEFQDVAKEFKKFDEQMRDPLVVGALLNKLTEERSSTNLILKEINAKLDRLEGRIRTLEGGAPVREKVLLPEVDEQIIAFVKSKKQVCADDVQRELKYKGKNAASARLNSLFKQGLLEKRQVGKKVFFLSR